MDLETTLNKMLQTSIQESQPKTIENRNNTSDISSFKFQIQMPLINRERAKYLLKKNTKHKSR